MLNVFNKTCDSAFWRESIQFVDIPCREKTPKTQQLQDRTEALCSGVIFLNIVFSWQLWAMREVLVSICLAWLIKDGRGWESFHRVKIFFWSYHKLAPEVKTLRLLELHS